MAKNFRNANEMLKQVQHDMIGNVLDCCHPELVSGSRFRSWVGRFQMFPFERGSLL